MKPIFLTLTLLLLAACAAPDKSDQTPKTENSREQTDTIKDSEQLQEGNFSEKEVEDLARLLESNPSNPEADRIVERTVIAEPEKKNTKANGATYHYFTGTKKVAVEITPWKNNRRSVICYDKNGNVTYTFDDVLLSYSEITEVHAFHPNGAAKTIKQRSNPGGSRYMPSTTYTFDEENYPLRSEYDNDEGRLLAPAEYTKTWDRSTRSWKTL